MHDVRSTARALRQLAVERRAGPLHGASLDDLAGLLGISRSTLLRRIGSRQALDNALADLGEQPGDRRRAAERAMDAAAELIGAGGVAAATLEAVASLARCTVQAIHTQIGGRDALLAATFERYSPLPGVTAVLTDPPADFAAAVRAVYGAVLDAVLGTPVIAALAVEAVARPDSGLARYIRDDYAVVVSTMIQQWFTRCQRAGWIRRIRPRTLLVLFTGPVLAELTAHVATGRRMDAAERARIAGELAESFCRAVVP